MLPELLALTTLATGGVLTPIAPVSQAMPHIDIEGSAPTRQVAEAKRCTEHIKQPPLKVYGSWRVTCVDRIRMHGVSHRINGITIPNGRVIAVKDGMSDAKTRQVYAHELGHAASLDRLTERQRDFFARRIGYRDFWEKGSSQLSSPPEVWASTYAACAGHPYPSRSYRVTSCQNVLDALNSPR